MSRSRISFRAAQLAYDLADDDHLRFRTCTSCRRKSDEGEQINGQFVCLTCIESGDVGGSEEPEVALTVNVRGEW